MCSLCNQKIWFAYITLESWMSLLSLGAYNFITCLQHISLLALFGYKVCCDSDSVPKHGTNYNTYCCEEK